MSGAVLATLGLAAAVSTSAAAGSSIQNCSGKIEIDGRRGKAAFPKGGAATTSINNVTITGCDMEIKANSASSPDFGVDNSSWTLDGNVRIRAIQQGSRISADQAIVKFVDSEIQLITITGSPAEFEQKRPGTEGVTRGHARKMIYEAGPGIVSLLEDAWLSDGSKEIKTPRLVYDIRKAEVRNTPSGSIETNSSTGVSKNTEGERIIITIDPKASKASKKPAAPAQNDAPSPAKP